MRKGFQRITAVLTAAVLLSVTALSALALDGVWHNPTGHDDLYGGKEIMTDPCERYPRDPGAGENVYIKSKTWPIEAGDAVWVTWTKNGVEQPVVNAEWKYNSGNDTYWEASLGSFAKGDVIEYYVHADQYQQNAKQVGPFSFIVTDWDAVNNVTSVTNHTNRVELACTSTQGLTTPKISISFPDEGYFRMQFEPFTAPTWATGSTDYTVDESNPDYVWIHGPSISLKINKAPYQMEVYDENGELITKESDRSGYRSLAFKTNGTDYVNQVEENLFTSSDESFTGFGMRYDALNQRGKNVDIYAVNWYLEQENKTYLPIPFYFSNQGYGTYLNSTYYTQYRLATDSTDRATIRANAGGTVNQGMDLYFFTGTPKEISQQYTDVIEKPELPPVWAFGPWISANEWNKQSEVEEQIAKANQYNIPTTGMVLEAWADEETFYMFADSQHEQKPGDWVPTSSDFTHGGRYPDPQGMIDLIHENGIRVLLWQLPLVKNDPNTRPQQLNTDIQYGLEHDYFLKNADGTPYLNAGGWYTNAYSIDFTNPEAVQWMLNKRKYLLEEVGIDGFKCDGGEFIWGRGITSAAGIKGDELRNLYPDLYVQAYYDFAKQYNEDALTFFRAGGVGAGQHPVAWTGDQNSTFSAYRDAMRATMTASMSGVPFTTWDLAGFSGEIPSTELYKRSVAQAAFSPIMQLHSEWGGDPNPSVARTPWNMYERTGDIDCINIYRKFANYRMNLIPYLYNNAKYTSDTGVPMMRSMAYEFPGDTTAAQMEFQYMLGDSLLVAPIENEGQTEKLIYLPEGEWIDLFWGSRRPGNQLITYYAGLDALPVFVKAGSVIPMNLNADYEFGGSVGNSTDSYINETYRIYPKDFTQYQYYDYVNGQQEQILVDERYDDQGKVHITLPASETITTVQVFTSEPTSVQEGYSTMHRYTDFAQFKQAASGWYYDSAQHLTYVRIQNRQTGTRNITLNGVQEVPYEAEFGELTDTSVNTNHTGYEGTGFVDNFASVGTAVSFDVYAPEAGTYSLGIRYSAGTEAATRSVYVNGSRVTKISLPKTNDWDTWSLATTNVTLTAGKNTIAITYDSDDIAGINLDNISLHQTSG